jgi:hypothetical protein
MQLLKKNLGWIRWLTPVIPATQEVDIRRIIVKTHPGQKASETPSQPINWT